MKHIWLARSVSILTVLAGVFLAIILIVFVISKTGFGKYLSFAKSFAFSQRTPTINILVMGKGGQGHEAPDLTDTMVLVSIDSINRKIVYVSIPRDIWVPKIRAKINSAYYWGNQKTEGGGLVLAKSTVEEIVGQPVNYAVVLDFKVFRDVVDVLGGIKVNVENSFEDDHYPIAGREKDPCNGDPLFMCRYETVKFETGVREMDGETALKFVRSRYAKGDEGTDEARQRRQQVVIKSIKDKMLTADVLLNPWKINKLYKTVMASIETDIDMNTQAILLRAAFDARGNVKSYSIPDDLLSTPPISKTYDNQYVFIPAGRSWGSLQLWFSELLR